MSPSIRVRVDASPPLFAELVRHALAGADIDTEGSADDSEVTVVTPDHLAGTSARIVIVPHDDTDAELTVLLDGQPLPAQRVAIEDIHDLVIDLASPKHSKDSTTGQPH
jgi:hypothetical protein